MHCTQCGLQNRRRDDGHRECPAGHVDYVNPAPAVGVAILRAGRVLLCRRARDPKQGQWDLVGGFVDPGETVPQAARREAREETGLDLRGLRRLHQAPGHYGADQPTLNFIYAAEADGEPTPADDVAELKWFPLSSLPALAWAHEEEALKRLRKSIARPS